MLYSINTQLLNIFANMLVNTMNLEFKKFDIVCDSMKNKTCEKCSPSLDQALSLKP